MEWLTNLLKGDEDDTGDQGFKKVENRSIFSGPNDIPTGMDELGNTQYQTGRGDKYVVKPKEDQRTGMAKFKEDVVPAVEDWMEDPVAPSMEQVGKFAKQAAKDMYTPYYNLAHGEGTYGDLWATVGEVAGVGTIQRAPKGAIRMLAGRSVIPDENINKYEDLIKTGIDKKSAERQSGVFYDDYNKSFRTVIPTKHAKFWDSVTQDMGRLRQAVSLLDSNQALPVGKLEHTFDFPEFLEKYPAAKDITLMVKRMKPNQLGAFYPEEGYLVLNPNLNLETMRSTVLHELQHFVQREEALKQGANPVQIREQMFKADPKFASNYKIKESIKNRIEKDYQVDPKPWRLEKLEELKLNLYEMDREIYAHYFNNRGELEARAVEAMDKELRQPLAAAASSGPPAGVTDYIAKIKAKANQQAETKTPLQEYQKNPEDYIDSEVHPEAPKYGDDLIGRPSDDLYGHMSKEKDPGGILSKMFNMGRN